MTKVSKMIQNNLGHEYKKGNRKKSTTDELETQAAVSHYETRRASRLGHTDREE